MDGALWEPLGPDDPQLIGPYPVVGRLAAGRRGRTYLARADDGPVVVTLLDPGWIASVGGTAGLILAVTTARRLPAGSGVAPVLDALLSGEECYVVSAFVPGPSVQALVERDGALSSEAVAGLAVATAAALAAVHEAGLAHQDVHPRSVVVGPDGPQLVGIGLVPAGPQRLAVRRPGGADLPVRVSSTLTAQRHDVRAWAAMVAYAATADPAFLDRAAAAGGAATPAAGLPPADVLAALPAPFGPAVRACLVADPATRPTARQVLDQLRAAAGQPAADAPATAGIPVGEAPTIELPVVDPVRTQPDDLPPGGGPPPDGPGNDPTGCGSGPEDPAGPTTGSSRRWREGIVTGAVVGAIAGGALSAGVLFVTTWATGAWSAPRVADSLVAPVATRTPVTPRPSSAASAAIGEPAATKDQLGTTTTGPARCTAVYDVVQEWPGGFKAEVRVVAGDSRVQGWRVTWSLAPGQALTQWWNAAVGTGQQGMVARNASYNGRLDAGATTSFGFVGRGPATPPAGVVTCTAQ
ncbi:MAG TPA: cellulose binding domain-containing protein [Kineosporiaceae bacterium]